MLENFLKEKIDACTEKIRLASSSIFKELNSKQSIESKISFLQDGYNARNIPDLASEFVCLGNLLAKFYWRSYSQLEKLASQPKKSPFSEEDLRNLASIYIEQILAGEMIASHTPMYHDIWEMIGKKGGPLEKFVTDDHRKIGVNQGFWRCLNMPSKLRDKPSADELDKIMGYDDFFTFFDFKKGAKKASALVPNISLEYFTSIGQYIRWYLVQETYLYSLLSEDKADEAAGKLIAPVVGHLFYSYPDSDIEKFRKLINVFVTGKVVHSQAVQGVLGEVFEKELELGFLGDDDFDGEALEVCERALSGLEKHVDAVWKRVKKEVDIPGVREDLRDYIPAEAYESNVAELKQKLGEMKRLDVNLLNQWMSLRKGKDIAKAAHSIARNNAIEVYYAQEQRPSGKDLEKLQQCCFFGAGASGEKFKAFLFADYILRKYWAKANDFLIEAESTWMHWPRISAEALAEYVKLHGKIPFQEEGLQTHVCYPKYNALIEFYHTNPEVFEVVSEKSISRKGY